MRIIYILIIGYGYWLLIFSERFTFTLKIEERKYERKLKTTVNFVFFIGMLLSAGNPQQVQCIFFLF